MAELAEEADVGRGLGLARVGGPRLRWPPAVLLDLDPLGIDSPADVLLHQLGARRDEAVDVLELALDEAFAEEERLLADLREAFVAAPRRGLFAALGVEGADHLSIAMADRQELVQRVEDRRVGQHATDQAEQVEPDEVRVLEV